MTAVGYEIRTTPAAKTGRPISVARRAADEAPLRPCRVIAITSGKGGVGKSNVSSNLSILLAAAGARVTLVDGDVGMGNLDLLMGVEGAPTLAGVATGRQSLEDVLVDLPCGVRLAAGGTGPSRAGVDGLAAILGEVRRARDSADFVILDCGSGIGAEVMGFCGLADDIIVVTTPEPTAMMDAYGLIKSVNAREMSGRVSLLVNMATDRQEARGSYARIASVAKGFLRKTVFDAGYVLADPKAPAAVRRRTPFVLAYPRCPASRCLTALAAKLRPGGAVLRKQARGGWTNRLAGWFG